MLKFYAQYQDCQPISIKISEQNLKSLTVEDFILAYQKIPNSPLFNVFLGDISLHLPENISRQESGLSDKDFSDINKSALHNRLCLLYLKKFISSDLVIQSKEKAPKNRGFLIFNSRFSQKQNKYWNHKFSNYSYKHCCCISQKV